MLRSLNTELYGSFMFIFFKESAKLCSIGAALFYILNSNAFVIQFYHILARVWCCHIKKKKSSHSIMYVVIFHCHFNLHFPNDIENLFICLFDICKSFALKCLFISLTHHQIIWFFYWILSIVLVCSCWYNKIP